MGRERREPEQAPTRARDVPPSSSTAWIAGQGRKMKREANLNEASHSYVGSSSRDAAEISLEVRDKSAEIDAYKAKRNTPPPALTARRLWGQDRPASGAQGIRWPARTPAMAPCFDREEHGRWLRSLPFRSAGQGAPGERAPRARPLPRDAR